MDLIDVLWRNDIATEKGARQLTPVEQYERDLQMLTEKSIYMVGLFENLWRIANEILPTEIYSLDKVATISSEKFWLL